MGLSRRELFMGKKAATVPVPPTPATATTPILHLLNRITWGPRPEEVERANQLGYEAMVEEQLHPESIDDSAADSVIQRLPILFMDRHTAHSLSSNEYRTYRTLVKGMILRAVHSRRQLLERVVEFWSDHFNIPADEYGPDLLQFQQNAIRKHALGNFRNLLIATAKSPAMLFYLNNAANVASHPNENYARELMELHSMGVDGGYTEQDVKEVARAFTGWTVHDGLPDGFYFDPDEHDTDAKVVLGHALPAGRGIEDALHVLSILANHPSTANFLCRKLCVRFVSDSPPQTLIDSMVTRWQESQGDIKAVLRHLFLSNEFRQSAGQKLRRPLDFLVGALRATGTQINRTYLYEKILLPMGQSPYGWHPPNGYPDMAGAWMSASGILARWNVAMRLTHAAYSEMYGDGYGLSTEIRERIGDPTTIGELVDAVGRQVFGAPLLGEARQHFLAYTAEGASQDEPLTASLIGRKLGSLYGLMLASPYYQWR